MHGRSLYLCFDLLQTLPRHMVQMWPRFPELPSDGRQLCRALVFFFFLFLPEQRVRSSGARGMDGR